MKKPEIARRWARESGLTPAEAADQLDATVGEILARLRQNGEALLPGLGKLRRGGNGKLRFECEGGGRRV